MDYPSIIAQLKNYALVFGGRVAGAAEYTASMQGEFRPETYPAAYVIPIGEEAEANDESPGLYQLINERFGVAVEFSNAMDRRGQGVIEMLAATRASIFSAILNWRITDPEHALRGIEAAGGGMGTVDRARAFYQWEFTFPTVVTELDGWQQPFDTLVEIDANSDAGDPQPPFKVTFPPA